jgi:hypothetical protein
MSHVRIASRLAILALLLAFQAALPGETSALLQLQPLEP